VELVITVVVVPVTLTEDEEIEEEDPGLAVDVRDGEDELLLFK
jgi:hypothetical protein